MLGVIPLSFQYAFVDGLTALGQPQYAITLSLTRKLVVFLGCLIVLPVFWGAQAGGVLRRACRGHLFRDSELRRLFNRIPEDIEKAGSRAARPAAAINFGKAALAPADIHALPITTNPRNPKSGGGDFFICR